MKMLKMLKGLQRYLVARFQRRFPAVALPNALGLMNENGIETLLLDPSSPYNSANQWPGRYLLVQRGVSGYQYGDACAGGPNGNLPLGTSADSPYASYDPFNVRRLGARPGLELGLAVPGTTVTIDKLLVAAPAGRVQDVSTLTAAGTYWVVGRAAGSLPANSSTGEVTFVPAEPYQAVFNGTTLAYPATVV